MFNLKQTLTQFGVSVHVHATAETLKQTTKYRNFYVQLIGGEKIEKREIVMLDVFANFKYEMIEKRSADYKTQYN